MGDMTTTLNTLIATSIPDIIICECNIRNGTYGNTETAQKDYILSTMKQVYYNSSSKIKGYMPYELLDELAQPYNEAHYGLVNCNLYGNIGSEKLAFILILNKNIEILEEMWYNVTG